jgi:hypothetical protein
MVFRWRTVRSVLTTDMFSTTATWTLPLTRLGTQAGMKYSAMCMAHRGSTRGVATANRSHRVRLKTSFHFNTIEFPVLADSTAAKLARVLFASSAKGISAFPPVFMVSAKAATSEL